MKKINQLWCGVGWMYLLISTKSVYDCKILRKYLQSVCSMCLNGKYYVVVRVQGKMCKRLSDFQSQPHIDQINLDKKVDSDYFIPVAIDLNFFRLLLKKNSLNNFYFHNYRLFGWWLHHAGYVSVANFKTEIFH